jgi:NADPH-dependent 2,4-dienoyl-CoA reductase/sulfur reductase-like enzyme/nitrite reductase/ring-hydroxylating ferredoxin subunit
MSKNIVIAKTNELQNGEMKTVKIDNDEEILLTRINDQFYATEAYCPHYGAPLETGTLIDKKIICPWHHAKFNIQNGELINPPALDGIASFEIKVEGDDVILISQNQSKNKDSKKSRKDETFLIIGGGAAGNAAAVKLRELGFDGHLIIVTADSELPYDRTSLSKDFLKGDMDPEWLPLKPSDYYKKNNIEIILEQKVKNVDAEKRIVELKNKTRLEYDKLLVASGSEPNTFHSDQIESKNIYTLRTQHDAEQILNASKNAKDIVIIGASFIGMEVAENLNKDNRKINVIAPETVPFQNTFGEDVGQFIKDKNEKNGLTFYSGQQVKEFEGNGSIDKVILSSGETVKTDLVIVGVGVHPVTNFMPHFNKATDGGLITDEYLQVENDVFAAGDIAKFPYSNNDKLIRVEHWRVAQQLGMIAAYNMLDFKKKINIIPFFWTNMAGFHIRYVGHSENWDETVMKGDLNKGNILVFYIKDKEIEAVLGINKDKHMSIIEELFRLDKIPVSLANLEEKEITPNFLSELLQS